MTTTEAAVILGVSPQRIRAMIAAGRLKASRRDTQRGPEWEIDPADLDAVKDRNSKGGRPKKAQPP